MTDKWSLGVLIGLPVLAIFIFVILAFIIGGFWADEPVISVGAFGALVIVLVVAGLSYWPWKTEYHKWIATEGTVTNASKRLIPAGEHGMQERIVLVVNGQQYGCDDTRCALVKPNDQIGLRCKKQFEWGSTNGYECKYVYHKAA